MTVTAARLGTSPITLDWTNLARIPAPGTRMQGPNVEVIREAVERMRARLSQGDVGFFDVPSNEELSQAGPTLELAEKIAKKDFTDCLFLGIGGSSLGPLSLLTALRERCGNPIRIHVMENPDPTEWNQKISTLSPETTLVCAVTKSGTTFETMAQLLLSLEWLGKARWPSHVVAITDPAKGDLKAFASANGIPTLHIAPSMGGRFSVFTPVGLFPAALAGLNVRELLRGAKEVRDYIDKQPHEKNPLYLLGHDLIAHYSKRPIHVCMPYSSQLRPLSAWFVQLWGESLGKDGKGFTPLAALGATDQHSILQLMRDGPDDKVTLFITVDKVKDEVRIPRATPETGKYAAFTLLQGHTLHELLRIEHRATSMVLSNRNRPHVTFQVDQLDERAMGAIYFAFSALTAFTGALWDVNPYDQPGVEEGKVYTRESLKEGLSAARREEDENDDNSPVNRLRRQPLNA